MYNSNFYHDAQLTCTQATDLILKNWRPNDDAEHLRKVLQDLLDLRTTSPGWSWTPRRRK